MSPILVFLGLLPLWIEGPFDDLLKFDEPDPLMWSEYHQIEPAYHMMEWATNDTTIIMIRTLSQSTILDPQSLSATNLEMTTIYEPVIVGKTNDVWVIRFKP